MTLIHNHKMQPFAVSEKSHKCVLFLEFQIITFVGDYMFAVANLF